MLTHFSVVSHVCGRVTLKHLHLLQETDPEVVLDSHQDVLYLRHLTKQFLPHVAQRVHSIQLSLHHRDLVTLQQTVTFLPKRKNKSFISFIGPKGSNKLVFSHTVIIIALVI